jgi:choline-sulfatase
MAVCQDRSAMAVRRETRVERSHRSLTCLKALVFALVGLIASPSGPARAQNSPSLHPVILISIDTLRADHLSAYGYTRIHTANIDSYAQGGTLFLHAEAQVPLTLPSHTALFTSTYPFYNGIEENGERVPAGTVTLASVLRSHGYKTAAFIGSEFLDRRYSLDQGFDVYDSPFGMAPSSMMNPLAVTLRRDGALVIRAAHQWLDAHRDQPVFVFIHLFDLHTPYTLPPEVARQKGISPYDAQLEYVDELMGRLQKYLKAGGWWDKSLVIVFGDHGEGLGDHQETDHGYYVYESTLHVPLMVHWPAAEEIRNSKLETGNWKSEAGVKSSLVGFELPVSDFHFPASISAPVGLIDVAPTILGYLHLGAPSSFQGSSRLSTARGSGDEHGVYSESLYAYDAFHWSPLRVLRAGKYKYIQAPHAELYDLDADPHERTNLLHRNAAMAAELQDQLTKVLNRYAPASSPKPSALSPETLAQLESLGYLAAEPHRRADLHDTLTLPDPKDRFSEFERYQNAFVALTEGRANVALPAFESIVNQDPRNTLARFHLGECYIQLKRPQQALTAWETALKFDPEYAPAAEAIGQYWMAQGDFNKARRRFQQVLALTPESSSAHLQLALADEHLGLAGEARDNLEAACKIDPHNEGCERH